MRAVAVALAVVVLGCGEERAAAGDAGPPLRRRPRVERMVPLSESDEDRHARGMDTVRRPMPPFGDGWMRAPDIERKLRLALASTCTGEDARRMCPTWYSAAEALRVEAFRGPDGRAAAQTAYAGAVGPSAAATQVCEALAYELETVTRRRDSSVRVFNGFGRVVEESRRGWPCGVPGD